MTVMSLRQWALRNGIPQASAYRYAKSRNREALRLPDGAVLRRNPAGGYVVDLNPEINNKDRVTSDTLLDVLDPHSLAEWLARHGYILLTTDEAQSLGITRASTPRRTRNSRHGHKRRQGNPSKETS